MTTTGWSILKMLFVLTSFLSDAEQDKQMISNTIDATIANSSDGRWRCEFGQFKYTHKEKGSKRKFSKLFSNREESEARSCQECASNSKPTDNLLKLNSYYVNPGITCDWLCSYGYSRSKNQCEECIDKKTMEKLLRYNVSSNGKSGTGPECITRSIQKPPFMTDKDTCFIFPITGHDTLGAVLNEWVRQLSTILSLSMDGAIFGPILVVAPHIANKEHDRNDKGQQISLLDLFHHNATQLEYDGTTQVRFLRYPPSEQSCSPGAVDFIANSARGVNISCSQRGRLGRLTCESPGYNVNASIITTRVISSASRTITLDEGEGGKCGYWFVRRALRISSPLQIYMSSRHNQADIIHIPFIHIAEKVKRIVAEYKLPCLEINYMSPSHRVKLSRTITKYVSEFYWSKYDQILEYRVLNDIRSVIGDQTKITKRKRVYGTMANAKELRVAAASPVLITEKGSLWSDMILAERCRAMQHKPSVVLEAEKSKRLLSESPHCGEEPYFLRGTNYGTNHYP
jgi:hypothetical protein